MGFWKGVACIAGAVGAVVAAPVVLPAVASAAAAAGAAAASTSVGAAVVGAAGTAASAASAAGAAAASTAVGSAVTGAAASVAGAAGSAGAAIASSAVGTAVAGAGTAAAGVATSAGVTAGGAAAATFGSGMTYSALTAKEAFDNNEEAESLIARASSKYKQHHRKLDKQIERTSGLLEQLNQHKMAIYSGEIKQTVDYMKRIQNVKESNTDYFDSVALASLFSKSEIQKVAKSVEAATSIKQQVSQGVGLASAAASMSTRMASSFGIASTGTAISSLSGAAAQRATLAALGGGSLKAGGAGMAGGQVMLGGISLVPVAVMGSWKMAKESERALTDAYEHYAKIETEIGKIETQRKMLIQGMNPRIEELEQTLLRLNETYRTKVLPKLIAACDANLDSQGKVDFQRCSAQQQNDIAFAANYFKSMVAVMRIKLMDSKGRPSRLAAIKLKAIEQDPNMKRFS